MKVNFNKTFKDYRGNDLIVGGKVQLMTDIIAQCLLMGKVLDHPVILIRIAAVKSIRMNCACVSYRQTGIYPSVLRMLYL